MAHVCFAIDLRQWLPKLLVAAFSMVLIAPAATAANLGGTVHYGGNLGPVSATRPIGVLITSDANLANQVDGIAVAMNDGVFSTTVSPGTYYVAVFLAQLGRPSVRRSVPDL